jgi:hypothetical protein
MRLIRFARVRAMADHIDETVERGRTLFKRDQGVSLGELQRRSSLKHF